MKRKIALVLTMLLAMIVTVPSLAQEVETEQYADGDELYKVYCEFMDAYFNSYPEKRLQVVEEMNEIQSASSDATLTRTQWRVIAEGMYAVGLTHSSFLMKHSLQDDPVNLLYTTSGDFAGTIKPLSVYKNNMLRIVGPYHQNPSSPAKKTELRSFAFTKSDSQDLYYSLHLVSLRVSMQRANKNSLYTTFISHILDRYDFAEESYGSYERFPTGELVALAYNSQQAGIIVPYNIDIEISGRYYGSSKQLNFN